MFTPHTAAESLAILIAFLGGVMFMLGIQRDDWRIAVASTFTITVASPLILAFANR